MNINNLYEAVPVEKELPPVHRMLNHKNCTSFYPVLLKDGPNDIAFYNYNTGLWVDRWYQSLKDDYEVSFWLRPVTRESIEAFLREFGEAYGKDVLQSISDTFLKPDNLAKASFNDQPAIQAMGETIVNFPMPDITELINKTLGQ